LRLDPKEAAAAAAAAEAEAEAAATEATCARHRRHATVSSASLRSPPVGARRCTGPMPPASGPVAFQASEPRAERGAWCAVEAPERRAERGSRRARATRGARSEACAAGFRVHPAAGAAALLLLQARLRFRSVRATRGARSAERGARSVVRGGGARATRGARSDGSYADVQYECQRASSCALLATRARVC
jgi:hypothetical protein